MEALLIIMILLCAIAVIIIMRFIGAWMFRIDEVIKNQYSLIEEVKKLNNNHRT